LGGFEYAIDGAKTLEVPGFLKQWETMSPEWARLKGRRNEESLMDSAKGVQHEAVSEASAIEVLL